MDMRFFNIRAYGILINEKQEVLISDELYRGQQFSKFPGGGLEFGESLPDAIRREFIEECNLKIKQIELLYITDSVVQSAFNDSQVLGIYYQVFTDEQIELIVKTRPFDFEEGSVQSFRWVSLQNFSSQDLTFRMDQEAWKAVQGKLFLK